MNEQLELELDFIFYQTAVALGTVELTPVFNNYVSYGVFILSFCLYTFC